MSKSQARGTLTLGLLDYVLMGVCSALAVYSIGQAVVRPGISSFMVMLTLLGTGFSYGVRVFARRSTLLTMDWVFYSAAVLMSMFFWRGLQSFLPDEGFPSELAPAAWLSWAIALGSFFSWQDGTLLFQAIPAIALFGLVGCYDTFRSVTFCFFGFLACLVTMFARAHGRAMFRQAIDSGYFNRIHYVGEAGSIAEDDAVSYQKIKEGPWRWIAGPEWALFSAFAIILLSFLGAPVIQFTVRSVAGSMSVALPQSVRQAAAAQTQPKVLGSDSFGAYQVGRGPNNIRDVRLFEADLDKPRYLRSETFLGYNGRSWVSDWDAVYQRAATAQPNTPTVAGASTEEIKNFRSFEFAIRPIVATRNYPAPGEVVMKTVLEVNQRMDGTLSSPRQPTTVPLTGQSIESDDTLSPKDAVTDLPASMVGLTDISKVSSRVTEFAQRAAKSGKTDFERAKLIQHAIEKQVKYNLNAGATPTGVDPVDYFLFDSKEGYCDLFASAMTVMARSVKLPARYVIGYLVEPNTNAGGSTYIVREADGHAWCEIFFKDVGWVVFDATEGAESVPGGERGAVPQGFWDRPSTRLAIGAVAFVLVVVSGLGAYLLARRLYRPKNPLQALDREHILFCRAIAQATQSRRNLAMTTTEYVEKHADALAPFDDDARQLASRFDRAYYSNAALDPQEIAALLTRVGEFRASLRKRPRE